MVPALPILYKPLPRVHGSPRSPPSARGSRTGHQGGSQVPSPIASPRLQEPSVEWSSEGKSSAGCRQWQNNLPVLSSATTLAPWSASPTASKKRFLDMSGELDWDADVGLPVMMLTPRHWTPSCGTAGWATKLNSTKLSESAKSLSLCRGFLSLEDHDDDACRGASRGPFTPQVDRGMAEAVAKLQGRIRHHKERESLLFKENEHRAAEKAKTQMKREESRRRAAAIRSQIAEDRAAERQEKAHAFLMRQKKEEETRMAAVLRIQAAYRGHQARLLAKQKAKRAAVKIQTYKTPGYLRQSTRKNAKVSREPPKQLADPADFKLGAELPAVNHEQLWEMLASRSGAFCPHLPLMDMLDYYEHTRETGLTAQVADILRGDDDSSPVTTSPKSAASDPFDEFTTRMLARMAMKAIKAPVEDAPPSGDTSSGYGDLGITHETYLGLKDFKDLIPKIAEASHIPEPVVKAHFAWLITGHFDIPDVLGQKLVEQCGLGRGNGGEVKFTETDFIRMCYKVKAVDQQKTKGISAAEVTHIFSATLRRMPELFFLRRQRRMNRGKPDDSNMPLMPPRKNRMVLGWTEFSILFEKLFFAMPKFMFRSPLDMIIDFLVRTHPHPPQSQQPPVARINSASRRMSTVPTSLVRSSVRSSSLHKPEFDASRSSIFQTSDFDTGSEPSSPRAVVHHWQKVTAPPPVETHHHWQKATAPPPAEAHHQELRIEPGPGMDLAPASPGGPASALWQKSVRMVRLTIHER